MLTTAGTQFQEEGRFHLFPLRKELNIHAAPNSEDGGREWSLHDPLQQRFFRLGWLEFHLISNWKEGMTPEELCQKVHKKVNVDLEPDRVKELHAFLLSNQLLQVKKPEYTSYLFLLHEFGKGGFLKKLLHHYLFFRIPLLKPDKILGNMLPYVGFVRSSVFRYLMLIMGTIGLYLVSRQWDSFFQTFQYFSNFEGLLWYALVLGLVKVAHELGHGLTAKYYGVKVPSMGLAFLVLMPVLYTDTTESWKLVSRRARLQIVAAGMLVELGLAVVATLLWNFLPEGVFKSAAFLVATVTWVLAALVNFNFFLRFDGYYFLSDFLEVPNLQDRSFALGKWMLRKTLFGFDIPPPELFSTGKRNFLIFYAYATWLYRVVLFLGIAVLVYFFFFKALGIFLMVVEILWFLVQPVWNEVKVWYSMKHLMTMNMKILRTALIALGLLLLLVFPLQESIDRSAYIKPQKSTVLFSPEPGILKEIRVSMGQKVKKGEVLVTVRSPELEYTGKESLLKVETLKWYLERKENTESLLDTSNIARQQLQEEQAKLTGARERLAALRIRAPFDGVVSQFNELLHTDSVVGNKTELMTIVNKSVLEVETYVPEQALKRLEVGGTGKFYPEYMETKPFDVEITNIEESSSRYLTEPWLASDYGGDVPVRKVGKGQLESHEAVYRVRLKVLGELPKLPFMVRGTVVLEAEKRSLLQKIWRNAAFVFVRESSF